MSSTRWERLNDLFHAASVLAPEARARLLEQVCADDPELRKDVERLVAAHARAHDFIESPAMSLKVAGVFGEAESHLDGLRCGAYRIVREIGRGGMGAVYLAERADGHYEQRVAIKLIKRGMDTDLLLQRFRAERQILASLDHPNIARLLDGGTTDDGRPYFVMEYIDGEPIDQFARVRQLSIAARLRLFLQICGAVAYAHRHLVIHRDIKPVNILVTAEGAPKLLDFGIAKVFDRDLNAPGSATTGFRLLTPQYASPEQVDGQRATAASDVYSLGVVLYELLTGRSPYRLQSDDPLVVAQAVKLVHPQRPSVVVTRASEPELDRPLRPDLTADHVASTGAGTAHQLRRQLRGDLDTIVLMALRKEPGRRYQTVEHLADDIQRHLDGRPVSARPDGVTYRTGKFFRRNRPSVIAATLAGVVVLLLGAGVLTLRSMSHGEDAAGGGILKARDRILVGDLADRTQDSVLTAALSDAFRIDLAQSPYVQVLTNRQVRSALTRMERPPDVAIDDSLAREIAVREGVKAFVTGSVSRAAGIYTISAQLVSATGDLLMASRETAEDSTDVIHAVDRLSERLRRRMGESLRSIQSTPALEQVTTSSLAALRLYTQGVHLTSAGDREQGLRFLERAVAVDTGFASAYRVMGVTYGDMVEYGHARSAYEHALANRGRLPFYERYHTIATYASNVQGDYPAAIGAYDHLLERYPDDVRALNNLGFVYGLERRYATQESLLTKAYGADSTIPTIETGIAMARLHQGDFAGAERAINVVKAKYPGLHQATLAEIYLASARQDWDAAERKDRERLRGATALDSLDGLETLAGIVLAEGRVSDAELYSRNEAALALRLGSFGRYYTSSLRIAWASMQYRRDSAVAIAGLNDALTRVPLDRAPEGDRRDDEIARFFAAAGLSSRAHTIMDAAAHGPPLAGGTEGEADRAWTRGTIAMAEGRWRDAVAELSHAQEISSCPICVLPDLAHAYDADGMRDSAIAVYERYVALPWQWRFETDDIALGWAFLRSGELYEQRGDRVRALAAYNRLVALWGRSDPSLNSVLADVRRRVARLQ